MNDYLTMDALAFIFEQESALLKRLKKYFADNKELIITGLTMLSGNYHVYFHKFAFKA